MIQFVVWKIGTQTGKSIKLVDAIKIKRVNVACLQETKWKGDKAKETTDGYKFYAGKNNAINGVVIVVDKDMKEKIVG